MRTLEENYYAQTLAEFIRCCDQEIVMLNWIRTRLPIYLQGLHWKRDRTPLRIIGVGSGNGIMDTEIAKIMLPYQRDIDCTAIEPDIEELDRFKRRVNADKMLLGQVSFDWNHCCSEEFEGTLEGNKRDDLKFGTHLVHMLQMLYHVRDLESSLMTYFGQLDASGLMLITLASKQGNEMQAAFQDYERKLQLDKYPTQRNQKRYSDDIIEILKRKGIPYYKENVVYRVDVSECFKERSKAGAKLLDFICLTNATRVYQTLAGTNRKALLESMSEFCSKDIEGRVTLKLSFDAILVYKTPRVNGLKV
ncbi:histamine N-methyltransferase-like [Amphiura filiformis]|uniref:histamine N-methyltransferase-like n=1 Tax=Amphiura filiformis TaxID=82378 RepID=UPI003B221EC0